VSSPNGTQAIDRAAMLLAQVVRGAEPASFTELTAACGLAKSTTSRLLMALERHQLVSRDDDGRFVPGDLFVRYAWRGMAGAHLIALAQPFLDQLGEQTSETINLGIVSGGAGGDQARADEARRQEAGGTARADGGGAGGAAGLTTTAGVTITAGSAGQAGEADEPVVVQIAQVNSRYLIGGTNWVGLAVPMHCSALGKALLAFGAAPLPAGPFEARTAKTITTRRALESELAKVRERGYAVTDEELEPGLVAVAAPVFAGSLAAIAALSVSAPASRLTADLLPAAAARCVTVANALSATLGGPPGLGPSHPSPPSDQPRSGQTEGTR
jgi:IclR family transcriptional regulator, acetate operon repressor